jgi:hypothetical protein
MKHDRQTYPNPWDFHNNDKSLKSSDGRLKIEYYDLNEIAMGAPLGGKCFLIADSNTKILIGDWCAGPASWNANDSMIAIPIWERTLIKGTIQKLIVINLITGEIIKYKRDFRVLDIRGFENGIIYGYDSPIHKPDTIEFNITKEKIDSSKVMAEFILKSKGINDLQIVLTNESDNDTFHVIARIIESDLGLHFKEKISGLEQRYWDFEFKGIVFTLHIEHYLGIMIFPKEQNIENMFDLIKELEKEIKKYWR